MKNIAKYILLFCLAFLIGCSSVILVKDFNLNGSTKWYWSNIYYSYYNFPYNVFWLRYDINNINFHLSPSIAGGKTVFMGIPYYITFFPNFAYLTNTMMIEKEYFYIDLTISNPEEELDFVFSNISFTCNTSKMNPIIKLRKDYILHKDSTKTRVKDDFFYSPFEYGTSNGVKKIEYVEYSQDTLKISLDTTAIRFEFPIDNEDVEECKIKFGAVIINGKIHHLPNLYLKRLNRYVYIPFGFD